MRQLKATFPVALPVATWKTLKRLAREAGVSEFEMIRQLIDERREKNERRTNISQ